MELQRRKAKNRKRKAKALLPDIAAFAGLEIELTTTEGDVRQLELSKVMPAAPPAYKSMMSLSWLEQRVKNQKYSSLQRLYFKPMCCRSNCSSRRMRRFLLRKSVQLRSASQAGRARSCWMISVLFPPENNHALIVSYAEAFASSMQKRYARLFGHTFVKHSSCRRSSLRGQALFFLSA